MSVRHSYRLSDAHSLFTRSDGTIGGFVIYMPSPGEQTGCGAMLAAGDFESLGRPERIAVSFSAEDAER